MTSDSLSSPGITLGGRSANVEDLLAYLQVLE